LSSYDIEPVVVEVQGEVMVEGLVEELAVQLDDNSPIQASAQALVMALVEALAELQFEEVSHSDLAEAILNVDLQVMSLSYIL
jgi:hypothetical protein